MREIILDTETTGLDPRFGHRIIEIGCIEVFNKVKTGKFLHLHINPERDVPMEAFRIHGISTEFLKDKPTFKEVAGEIIEFVADSRLIIHNAPFDLKFLNAEFQAVKQSLITTERVVDTLVLAKRKFPGAPASLDALCKKFNISNAHRTKHGALLDSELLYDVYIALTEGIQSELKLAGSNQQKAPQIVAKEEKRPSVPYRDFPPSTEELEEHLKFLQKINDSSWQRTRSKKSAD